MQMAQAAESDQCGSAPGPPLNRTCPDAPVPIAWRAPVPFPAIKEFAVKEVAPVPPCATLTVLNPAPSAPEVSVPTPVILEYTVELLKSPLVSRDVDNTPAALLCTTPCVDSALKVTEP